MTLTTHAIIGASAAQLFSFHPAAAIAAAFLSHFVIDAIPHWDYLPRSFHKDTNNPLNNDMIVGEHFGRDFIVVAIDASLGMILSLAIFSPHTIYNFWIVFLGVVFGILPDPLQFMYWKIRTEPFLGFQRFHLWIHSKNESWTRQNCWKIGLFSQFAIVIAFWLLTKL